MCPAGCGCQRRQPTVAQHCTSAACLQLSCQHPPPLHWGQHAQPALQLLQATGPLDLSTSALSSLPQCICLSERQKHRNQSSDPWLIPKVLAPSGPRPGQRQEPRTPSEMGLPQGWAGKYRAMTCCLPEWALAASWNQKRRWGLDPKHASLG